VKEGDKNRQLTTDLRKALGLSRAWIASPITKGKDCITCSKSHGQRRSGEPSEVMSLAKVTSVEGSERDYQ